MTQWKPKQLEFKPKYEKYDETDKEVWFVCDIPELGIEYDWEFKSKSVLVNINPFSNAFVGHADTIEQANDLINADFGKRWQAMSEPRPFWKPISEFEKTNGNQCLIVDNGKLLHVKYDANHDVLMAEMSIYADDSMKAYKSFHLDDLTHFADVPNLEASK